MKLSDLHAVLLLTEDVSLADVLGVTYILIGLICLFILRVALANRDNPGSGKLSIMILGIIIMGGATGVQFIADSYRGSEMAWIVLILGADLIVIGWFLYTVEYTNWRPIRWSWLVLLGLKVFLTQLAAWTNPHHHLALRETSYVDAAGFHQEVYGPVFWGHCAVGYSLMFLSIALLIREFIRSRGVRRKQIGVFLVSLTIPLTLNILYVFRIQPLHFTLTPVGFFIAAVGLSWAIYRASFLDLVPVGRKTAIQAMGDAFITVDGENRIVDYNDAARRLFDIQNEPTGKDAGDFFGPHADTIVQFDDVAAVERELTLKKDGERRHYHFTVSPVQRPSERGTSYVVVFNDVTPLKRREEELRRTTERLDQFAGVVSHDLRNPLTVATGRLELAEERGEPEDFEVVRSSLNRMDQMIDELLTEARSRGTVENLDPVSLNEVVRESWKYAQTGTAEIELVLPAEVTVMAESQRLLHIFENLFRNAVDHNDSAVTIRVGIVGGSDAIETDPLSICIEDDGTGIPEDQREDVLDHGYTTASNGTGFGLSIVQDNVEAHGWGITVTESSDGGARFEITGVNTET